MHFQRPGLALANGAVYIAFSSHEDVDPYHGWVLAFNASTYALVPNGALNVTPNKVGTTLTYSRSGIWMSGGAPAVDAGNNLYLSTGNGTFDANTGGSNYGDSTLKLGTGAGLAVADWFPRPIRPRSTWPTAIMVPEAHAVGECRRHPLHRRRRQRRHLFVLLQSSLGHYGGTVTPADSNVHQEFNIGHTIFATPAFWNNAVYIAGVASGLQNYTFDATDGLFNTGAASISSHALAGRAPVRPFPHTAPPTALPGRWYPKPAAPITPRAAAPP